MGIRYDRDQRRPSNGPTIFFTDPAVTASLCEEIKRALEKRYSFYLYRLPHDMMLTFGVSEGFLYGIGIPGFVISPFNNLLSSITIPWKPVDGMMCHTDELQCFPTRSTYQEEHSSEVEAIIRNINGDRGAKTVAATVTCVDGCLNPEATFMELCKAFPECFVFMFSTPATGCWTGASPELLLKANRNLLSTVALAGTRPAYSPGGWDKKNIEEQATVTQFITDAFKSNYLFPIVGETYSKRTGRLEHICTPVTSTQLPENIDALSRLLADLSPTPAICGLPREKSLEIISEYESFTRHCYGGFCGPFTSPSEFTFYVTLRCVHWIENKIAVYAGGGITHLSVPAAEWDETRRKAEAILSRIILKS